MINQIFAALLWIASTFIGAFLANIAYEPMREQTSPAPVECQITVPPLDERLSMWDRRTVLPVSKP